jgi:cell division topological specificity factor
MEFVKEYTFLFWSTGMKNLLKFFRFSNKKSAKTAKERLQIVVSHQRANDTSPEFLPELRKELLNVICKYIAIDIDQINVNLQREGNCSILELNVAIPEPIISKPAKKRGETKKKHTGAICSP